MMENEMLNSYLFALLAMFLWGIAPIFGKMGLGGLEPLAALTIRSTVITALLAVFMLVSGKWPSITAAGTKDIVFIAIEGICAALLGQLAYYYAIKYGGVTKVTPVVSAFPLVAIALAVIFLGEKITVWKMFGAVLIVGGVILLKL